MGIDFIRSKRQSRRKAWNYQMGRGGEDLLTTGAPRIRQACRATVAGALPVPGHTVVLQLTPSRDVLVREGTLVIGNVKEASAEVIATLARHSGMVTATVVSTLKRSHAIDLVVED